MNHPQECASDAQRSRGKKIVVEIGGGIGMLSVAMGAIARRIYCRNDVDSCHRCGVMVHG
jgi:hypothetical protein